MQPIKINVTGAVGSGKSHVLAVIEKALIAEYGPLMKVTCDELTSERNTLGSNIDSWNKPDPTQIELVLTETTGALWEDIKPIPDFFVPASAERPVKDSRQLMIVSGPDDSLMPALKAVFEDHVTEIVWQPPGTDHTDFLLELKFTEELRPHISGLLSGLHERMHNNPGWQQGEPTLGLLNLYVDEGQVANAWMIYATNWKWHGELDNRILRMEGSAIQSATMDNFAKTCWMRRHDRPGINRGYSEQIESLKKDSTAE